ncbi:response regulator transcription factor [Egibacter rhizosphaerae]|uniref:Response regulator transcription factor n=1 Tax=Egibacter rhizosphaerae TaxID=1670831 RepID=A0A411YBJ8_9ACTN|nr:response regulator transcription factor [Egibacter rhizosphaerae]QBI18584.1 response regulator transcription factor [Egibacter rhizosphaerae]
MIEVCVVDDQTLVRQGIRSLLSYSGEVVVTAEASDGDEALEVIRRHRPDVVLLDLRMPRRDGIATLEALRGRGDETPVLVLTTFDDDELVLHALRSGAHGYLLKDVTFEHLIGAVRTLAQGGTLVEPSVTQRLLDAAASQPQPGFLDGLLRAEDLSERELEILRLMAAGYANHEIADVLYLAPGTVKNHVSSLLLKLGVRDRTRAVLRALDLGLLGARGQDDVEGA